MKFKIKINYEKDINADSEENALELFWESQNYPQHNIDTFLDEIIEVEKI